MLLKLRVYLADNCNMTSVDQHMIPEPFLGELLTE